ncbi:MAG: hypothetical protein AAB110_05600 [Candidatus Desantisbacteria bacterium]
MILNIFWKYWKGKNVGQAFLSATNSTSRMLVLQCWKGKDTGQAFLFNFLMCVVMVCSWSLLLVQTASATPPLYPGMGSGHRDDVAPMHYRMEEGE